MTLSLRHLVVALLALVLTACATKVLMPSELRMSASELTTRMEKRFPVDKSVAGLVDVTFSRPVVTLAAPRMLTRLDVLVKIPLSGRELNGSLAISGIPHYDPVTRGLYLKDAAVDRITLDNMPTAMSGSLAIVATQVAKNTFDDKPFHTFREEDFVKYGIFSYDPLSLQVRDDGLVLRIRR